MRRGALRFGEIRMARGDRECDSPLLVVAQGLSGINGEFPRNVVKAGPEVSYDIPHYARQAQRWLGCDDTFDAYVIGFNFGEDFVGLCVYVSGAIVNSCG